MKTATILTLCLAVGLLSNTARAGFFEEIQGDLAGPAAKEAPEYTALYFSAHWCPPCRMFTPKLVEWYKGFKKTHPNFELVFVSADRDEAAMEEYIKDTGMPWPVVKFDRTNEEIFRKYSSDGIPYLVLVGKDGKDLTGQSGNEWQSPEEVLSKIEKIVPGS